MKVIYNNIIPFKGFKAINLFGILFARKGSRITETTIVHETIHTKQMKELFYIFFYVLYILEWIINLIRYLNSYDAYRNISFEKEAYMNQYNKDYLTKRVPFAQWKNKL